MEIIKVAAFALLAVILVIVIKQEKKEIGVIISIVACIALMLYAIKSLDSVTSMIDTLITKSGINTKYLEIILKIIGIAYIVELTKNICEDAGEVAIGSKVEMAGKIIMTTLTIPIILGVIEVITNLI